MGIGSLLCPGPPLFAAHCRATYGQLLTRLGTESRRLSPERLQVTGYRCARGTKKQAGRISCCNVQAEPPNHARLGRFCQTFWGRRMWTSKGFLGSIQASNRSQRKPLSWSAVAEVTGKAGGVEGQGCPPWAYAKAAPAPWRPAALCHLPFCPFFRQIRRWNQASPSMV